MIIAKNHHVRWFLFVMVTSLFFVSLSDRKGAALAQVSTRVASVEPSDAAMNTIVRVQARLLSAESISSVLFLYRPFAVNEWSKLEMDIVGNTAAASIPAKDVLPPFIDYYLVLVDRSGTMETYPLSESADPLSTPPGKTLQITVKAHEQTDQQITFLSPEPFATVPLDEFLLSVSLLRVDTVVDRQATRLFLDATDVTANAVFSGDIIVYAPEDASWLTPGAHRATVRLFDHSGEVHGESSINFTIPGGEETGRESVPSFTYRAAIQLESRNEQISNSNTWYNRGNLQFSGKSGDWQILSRLFVTSDEKSDRQPQNRYFAGIESSWLKASYGDAFPSFPSLILSGKRVRGLSSAVKLGFFNVDLTLGKTTRDIEGALLKTIRADTLALEQQRDPNGAYDRIDDQTWGKYNYGTYARDLFAVRPSFGSGETWQLGFTWLKSKDDVGSIRHGVRPQENFVVGSDFFARFDDNCIEIGAQGAFSAFNSDIKGGTFTDEQIDSLFRDDEQKRSDARKVRDALRGFITVNENLTPLSFKRFPTVAYEGFLALNYFDQAVRFTYLYRGSNYHSFGQTFLRNDVQGFNIVDRVRLIGNQLFVTAGYEQLKDNTSDTKQATTTFSNFNLALSFSPIAGDQTFTIGYARYASNNKLPLDSLQAINDETNRFFLQSTFDFEAGAKHTLSLNFSASDRDDKTAHAIDVKNSTIAMGIASQYSIPLRTSVDVAFNINRFPGSVAGSLQDLNYTSVSFNGRYGVADETVILMATVTPTFGDFKRTVVDLGAQWFALPSMSFLLQFTHFDNRGPFNDKIWSLRYQYDV